MGNKDTIILSDQDQFMIDGSPVIMNNEEDLGLTTINNEFDTENSSVDRNTTNRHSLPIAIPQDEPMKELDQPKDDTKREFKSNDKTNSAAAAVN